METFLLKGQIALQKNELQGSVEILVQMLPNTDFIRGYQAAVY